MLRCLELRHDGPGGPYAAKADTRLDDYRRRRGCSGGSTRVDPRQLWHVAKSSLFARASHFDRCKPSSERACHSGNSGDFQHVLALISLRPAPFRGSRRASNAGFGHDIRMNYPKSISFYCSVGDPTPFPEYKLEHNARRFQATIGLPAGSALSVRSGHTPRWRWTHSPDL